MIIVRTDRLLYLFISYVNELYYKYDNKIGQVLSLYITFYHVDLRYSIFPVQIISVRYVKRSSKNNDNDNRQ